MAWYQDRVSDAVGWAVSHPTEEVRLTAAKVWETWSTEGRVVEGARNYQDPTWAGSWMGPLGTLARGLRLDDAVDQILPAHGARALHHGFFHLQKQQHRFFEIPLLDQRRPPFEVG